MKISFQNKKLEKLLDNYSKLTKELGPLRTKIFLKRIGVLVDALTLEDVRNEPGNFHELKGDRKGQWACDLDQPYRLIFEPHEDPIPTDDSGRYLWVEITGIEIIEITNYHGK
ncbi:MAG: killer suppression protein HigA [Bacteroides sp.]|nr:killer suppression protein HigA [Bacteroides sp.]